MEHFGCHLPFFYSLHPGIFTCVRTLRLVINDFPGISINDQTGYIVVAQQNWCYNFIRHITILVWKPCCHLQIMKLYFPTTFISKSNFFLKEIINKCKPWLLNNFVKKQNKYHIIYWYKVLKFYRLWTLAIDQPFWSQLYFGLILL